MCVFCISATISYIFPSCNIVLTFHVSTITFKSLNNLYCLSHLIFILPAFLRWTFLATGPFMEIGCWPRFNLHTLEDWDLLTGFFPKGLWLHYAYRAAPASIFSRSLPLVFGDLSSECKTAVYRHFLWAVQSCHNHCPRPSEVLLLCLGHHWGLHHTLAKGPYMVLSGGPAKPWFFLNRCYSSITPHLFWFVTGRA